MTTTAFCIPNIILIYLKAKCIFNSKIILKKQFEVNVMFDIKENAPLQINASCVHD